MIKTLHLLVCLLAITSSVFSQAKEAKLEREKVAREHVEELKKGVLLVRLKTEKAKLEALKKVGTEAQVKALENEIRTRHENIANAFKSDFNFCSVLFFYSHQSELIKSGEFSKLSLYDADLKPLDPLTVLPEEHIYIAEFGRIENANTSSGQIDFGFQALVIRDVDLNQLKRPFPYYQKTNFLIFPRTYDVVVSKWNTKLSAFYANY